MSTDLHNPHQELILKSAQRTTPLGPKVTQEDALQAVSELQSLSVLASEHIARITGMHADVARPALVVDRAKWIASNVDAIDVLMGMISKESSVFDPLSDRANAFQTGLVLGWASGRVLGQYEAFSQEGTLLLVAPNIVKVEQTLDVDPMDFRMWVCLHEETHRVQFGAVPWMRDYFVQLINEFVNASKLNPIELTRRIVQVVHCVITRNDQSIIELVQSDEQKEIYLKISALMTLLEGHADFVMDLGGPEVIPTVNVIRERFEERRDQNKGFVSHLLGMNEKLAQYRNGAAFVSSCVDAIGMEAFNQIWQRPENLPSTAEIQKPALWQQRMLTEA